MIVYNDIYTTIISKKSKMRIWDIMLGYIQLSRFKDPRMCNIPMYLNSELRGYRGCQIGYDKLLKSCMKVAAYPKLNIENGVIKYDNALRLMFKTPKYGINYAVYSIFNTNGLLIKPNIKTESLPRIYDKQPHASM